MSGLLALLDDVAAIAKVAAASVDDVIGQDAKAGSKAAGAVIDDAAVTPKYLRGFSPARELPIVWRIAKGSFKNKLLFLLPAALLLSSFATWAIAPLLMLGGCYLCFEGAEKIVHAASKTDSHDAEQTETMKSAAHLEEERAAGAIKTDFILSAEIMTIALAALPPANIWMQAASLAAVGIGITILVYGGVALIVKADDVGLHMAEESRFAIVRQVGRSIVRAMPRFLTALTVVGTAAMLWVGGAIIIHGLEELGLGWLGHEIKHLATFSSEEDGLGWRGPLGWLIEAGLSGVFGLAVGLALIPVVNRVLQPAFQLFRNPTRARSRN
jgi:predicted DNA repair protein MutK